MNRELDFSIRTVHEAIEGEIKKEGLKPKPVQPIEAPVLAEAHTAIYKMHRYYARRPHNVFAKLIMHYSNPGDLILDPFCGGGVTVVEGLKLRRRVIGIDLNPLATWVTKMEVAPINIDKFGALYTTWIAEVAGQIESLYKARCLECNRDGVAEWYEWSNVVVCPGCRKEIVLGTARKKGKGLFQCPNPQCGSLVEPSKCKISPDRMLAVVVRCKHCGTIEKRDANTTDIRRYEKIRKTAKAALKVHKLHVPGDLFPDMDRARDDNIFGKGIKYFKDLMTVRQQISCAWLKKKLPRDTGNIPELETLWHLYSSTLRYTNKFVFQSANWQSGKPVEWAGHNYWLPFHYIELNPLPYLAKRYAAFLSGKEEQALNIGSFCRFPATKTPWKELQDGATCYIINQSSHKIPLPDGSVDAIITDPPFGGNVQYGELSDFYLAWVKDFMGLKGLSDKNFEAIETRHSGFDGAKDRSHYEQMLYKIFIECRRVIKSDGWLVLTFHNRDIGVWMSLHRAALRAGFRLPLESESQNRGMVYQPPVQNYTQTIHQRAAGSMLGDFILSFKPVQPPARLEAIKEQLSTDEERDLRLKAEEIIRYHGGADETTLMTGLIPYLHERALLHRIAKYDLKTLLDNGPFIYVSKEKKWYTKDMVEESGSVKMRDFIPAEAFVQNLVHSFLSEKHSASMDELLILIYSNLVNSHRPQISTIERIVARFCVKKKMKGMKREVYVWNPHVKTPDEIKRALTLQTAIDFGSPASLDHNAIIKILAQIALKNGFSVHIGVTEQHKSPDLSALSAHLTGMEFGLPPEAFRIIKEIDLIIFQGSTILGAVEVATSISTFGKAVNNRFRNLLTVAPNLTITLAAIVNEVDLDKAHSELFMPANVKSGLAGSVLLLSTAHAVAEDIFLNKVLKGR
ncbi:MAG: DNA methyltransferase [candidate division Zixibacteria bacterium]|nr:DNA methyltransferase [candidate division Zixibacteria bacterium]